MYSKPFTFPLSIVIPGRYEKTALNYLSRRPNPLSDAAVYENARGFYEALSLRLGDHNAYFFGENPHILDAIVFGHLSVHLRARLPDDRSAF